MREDAPSAGKTPGRPCTCAGWAAGWTALRCAGLSCAGLPGTAGACPARPRLHTSAAGA